MKVVIPVGSLETGGGCKTLVDTANALVKRGHQAEIVIPNGMPIKYPVHAKVRTVPTLSKDYIPYGDIILANYYITFLPAFQAWPQQVVRLCQGFEPYWVPDKDFATWTYNQNVPIISISHWLNQQIVNAVQKPSSAVVNLGIDPQIFHPIRISKPKRKKKIILYIARDPNLGYAVKGFSEFAQAMKMINRKYKGKFIVHLICPENRLRLPGIAHRVFQPQTDVEMANLYRQADVFVSSSRAEGYGLPPLEAMACATPVVTTNSGGVMDFAAHGHSAFVVPPLQPRALANGIVTVLKNKPLSNRLVQGGLAASRRLTKPAFEHNIVHALQVIHRYRVNRS
ncbi:glycosyltransferase family 4 protein [Caldalkalibacillus salinus]|uniref:glycosyltransferase family 4 protein n=1 Tax=Caldalkalibacillus salinus TaxID=2803787 RepID=UPI001923613F|nr:glycosyltransferase family 4 protein [Caldalkalibacillus salinus]